MTIPIIIWGAGDHAKTAADVALAGREYSTVGFLDDLNTERHGASFCGSTILGSGKELESLYGQGNRHIFVAIGDNKVRLDFYRHATEIGFKAITLIHPFTSIAKDCRIGGGTIIRAGTVLEADIEIGRGAIIGANTSMGHGCRVEDGARIALGSTMPGSVKLGRRSRIGPGCTILNHVCVGEDALLGAGSVLTCDLPANTVAMGSPARVVREVTEDDF